MATKKNKYRKTLYDYDAEFRRVVDGDTIEVMIDKGIKQYAIVHLRYARLNCDELTSTDPVKKARAQAAVDYNTARIPKGAQLYVISNKLDPWLRLISEIWYNDVNLNDELLGTGLADPYPPK